MDITEEILHQHTEQRRLFAVLDEIEPDAADALAAVWARLAALLETHAAAEEKFVYPRLLRSGDGPPGADEGPEDETKDAVKDHNQIRDAVRRANAQQPATQAWWDAVRDAREANSDHMAEEERDDLPDLRRNIALDERHRIAVDFVVYQTTHPDGVERSDRDPDDYVEHPG